MFAILISTIMMGVIGLLVGIQMYRGVSKVPTNFMAPAIVALSIVGAYAVRNSSMDVIVMLVFGLLGYILKEMGLAPGALVLGLILGPIAEAGFVRSSLIGQAAGYFNIFVKRPISLILIALTLLSLIWPIITNYLSKRGKGRVSGA